MHAVVFDFQVCNTAARTLATFEVDEKLCATSVDAAQLIELSVIPGGYDATIAKLCRWISGYRARE